MLSSVFAIRTSVFIRSTQPNHPFNDAIKSMLYASTFDEALSRYLTFSASVSPWLCPRLMYSQSHIHIYWLDENKLENRFLIESAMSAIQAFSRQLYQTKLVEIRI